MKVHHLPDGAFVVLERGEEVVASLSRLIGEQGLGACTITGIGALRDVEVGFFEVKNRAYIRQVFPEAELLSMSGNASSLEDGGVAVHLHVVLGLKDFRAVGGHLFAGTVSVTAEIRVQRVEASLVRREDQETGLRLLA